MASHQLTALIFIVVYYVFVIGLSLYRRMVKSELDYFLASRTFAAWILISTSLGFGAGFSTSRG